MLELFGIKEKKVEVKEEKDKEINIFTYLTDIMSNKRGDVHEKHDPFLSKFDTFMILRFLSYDEGYLPYINIINGFQDILTKEEAYKLLVLTIPRTKKFLKFPKKNNDVDDSDVDLLSKYFECSRYKVEDFIRLHLLDKHDIEKIKEMFGGKR